MEGDQTNTSPSSDQERGGTSSNNGMKLLLAVLLLAALGALGYWYFFYQADETPSVDGAPTADLILGTDRETGPVARVNGTEIPRKEYENSVVSLAEDATAQGADITNPTVQGQIKDQAIQTLINSEILLQQAVAAGITVTDEEVASEFDAIVANFGTKDALLAQLAAYDVNETDLRDDLKKQLMKEAYVAAEVDAAGITVSEEEITTFYNSLTASGQQIPERSEIESQIEAELLAQKQQEFLTTLLESLHAEAEIEILV